MQKVRGFESHHPLLKSLLAWGFCRLYREQPRRVVTLVGFVCYKRAATGPFEMISGLGQRSSTVDLDDLRGGTSSAAREAPWSPYATGELCNVMLEDNLHASRSGTGAAEIDPRMSRI